MAEEMRKRKGKKRKPKHDHEWFTAAGAVDMYYEKLTGMRD
jgi:hypothetical protein